MLVLHPRIKMLDQRADKHHKVTFQKIWHQQLLHNDGGNHVARSVSNIWINRSSYVLELSTDNKIMWPRAPITGPLPCTLRLGNTTSTSTVGSDTKPYPIPSYYPLGSLFCSESNASTLCYNLTMQSNASLGLFGVNKDSHSLMTCFRYYRQECSVVTYRN